MGEQQALIPCAFCSTLNRVDLERAADRPRCGKCSRPMLVDRPVRLSGDDLDRVVRGTKVPLLVDFYADWCGPCKIMAPVLDEIARSWIGRAIVGKLDTDRNPEAAATHSIRAIPTLILFHGGREVSRQAGAVPRQRVETMLEAALDEPAA